MYRLASNKKVTDLRFRPNYLDKMGRYNQAIENNKKKLKASILFQFHLNSIPFSRFKV